MSSKAAPRWALTRRALEKLLDRLNGRDGAAEQEYEYIRRRLITFFKMRGIPAAEALADQTLDHIAHKLEQGQAIEHPRAYVAGVAQRMALKWETERARERAAAAEARRLLESPTDALASMQRIACLKRCLRRLPRASRELIVRYHREGGGFDLEGRRHLADRLGITYSTLKARAQRIRAKLEQCVRECLQARGAGGR